jgi:hypothetical protein
VGGFVVGAVVGTVVVGVAIFATVIRSRICLSPPNRRTSLWSPAGSVTCFETVVQPMQRLFGTASVPSELPSRLSARERPSAHDATEQATVYVPADGTARVYASHSPSTTYPMLYPPDGLTERSTSSCR